MLEAIALPAGPWVVAVSGGPDSVALLLLVAQLGPPRGIQPVVAHVDHGIDPDSAAVAALVRRHAEHLGLPFRSVRLELGPAASETIARRERYAALHRIARDERAQGILTAHHANDQVETVLMRVLRGSGPAGLAGMDVMTADRVVRPLLRFPLAYLLSVVQEAGVAVWEDPANRDPTHLRSWIRMTALPTLRTRLPDVYSRLLEVAEHARDHREAWDDLLDRLPGLDLRHETTVSVAVDPWLVGGDALARQVVAAVGRRAGVRVSRRAIERALKLVQAGASGRRAEVGGGWEVEFSFGRLVLSRLRTSNPATQALVGDLGRLIWHGWEVRWRRGTAGQPSRPGFSTWISPGDLEIGTMVPGERMQPLGFSGHRPLVRLFQDARVPVGERRGWPVVRRAGQVVWVPGVCRGALHLPPEQGEALEVQVSTRPSVAALPQPT